MKWNKFRLKTTTEAEDIVSSMLADLGIEGVEIEDKIPLTESDKEQMFVDILPEIEADDGVAYLSFYLEEDEDKEKVLANVKKELEEMSAYVNVGACEIEESQTEDVDWVNNWKKYFHQFYVDDILIIPSWEDVKPSDEDKMVIHIDPGTAFGTGMQARSWPWSSAPSAPMPPRVRTAAVPVTPPRPPSSWPLRSRGTTKTNWNRSSPVWQNSPSTPPASA